MITHKASESVYCTTKRHKWFESLDYYEQWAGMADSKICESVHHFWIESNWNSQFEFESNLAALQMTQYGVSSTKLLYTGPGYYLNGWFSAESKTFRQVTNHLGQLSLLSLWVRLIEYQPVWIWQVMPRSSEMTCSKELYHITLNHHHHHSRYYTPQVRQRSQRVCRKNFYGPDALSVAQWTASKLTAQMH